MANQSQSYLTPDRAGIDTCLADVVIKDRHVSDWIPAFLKQLQLEIDVVPSFAEALAESMITAEMLCSPATADRCLHQVILLHTFRQLPEKGLCRKNLTDLYSRYKLLLLAHSPVHYRKAGTLLGNMPGRIEEKDVQVIREKLYRILCEGLLCLSRRKRHVNALMHIQGYFKRQLDSVEKRILSRTIDQYGQGTLPLSAPVTLLRHYLSRYPDDYLQVQLYLHPYNENYGLRNYL